MVGSGNRHRQQLIKKPSLARKSPMVEGHLGRARPARPPPQRPPSVASAHGQSAELRILRLAPRLRICPKLKLTESHVARRDQHLLACSMNAAQTVCR